MRVMLLVFVLWTVCFEFIFSSHFYGGTVSLIPTDTGTEHTTFYTVHERTSYTSVSHCGTLKNSSNYFYGWSLCFNSKRQASTTHEFTSGDWGGQWKGASSWTLSAWVNERREDNGLPNTSPVTESLPLLPLQVNCAYNIHFPVYDVDDDTIRCRFANGVGECNSACDKLTGALLNGSTCTLSYTATSTGNLPLAIQVEDFYDTSSVTALSSAPLQILLHAVDTGRKCNELPEIIRPIHSSLYCLRTNASFTLNITARSIYSLTAIDSTLYPGMTTSAIYNTWSDRSYQYMSTNLTWTPTADDVRPHIVCMSARDLVNAPSEQTCVTLLVSSVPELRMTGKTLIQTGDGFTWEILYNMEITPPGGPAYINIYQTDDDSLIHQIDTASSPSIQFYTNSFQLSVTGLDQTQAYYMLFDAGIVRVKNCDGTTSAAVTNKTEFVIAPTKCGNISSTVSGGTVITNGNTTVGSNATVVCNEGYENPSTPNVTCQSNGTWSRASCSLKDCGHPTIAVIGGTAVTHDVTTVGSNATVKCSEGYETPSSSIVTCQTNGTWSRASCSLKDCKVLEVPDHVQMHGTVTTYGGRLNFTCTSEDDVLVGSRVIECLGNGLWNDSVPDCNISYGGSCTGDRPCFPSGAQCIDGSCRCKTGVVDLKNQICDTMPLSEYGTDDNTLIDAEEECIGPVTFAPGFMVFGASRQSIYICPNGFVSLDKKYTDPRPPNDTSVLADFDVLGPFYADTAEASRNVYYRHYDIVTNRGAGLNKDDVTNINVFIRNFGDKPDFQATFVLFVTWVEVESFDNSTNGKATFQLVIATDGKATFALYIYEHNGMKWTSSLPNPDIWIGYHLNVNHSESSLFSFTQRALNIDQFATTKGVHGVTLYRLNTLNEMVDARVVSGIRCYRWYNENYERQMNSLPDCPCDLRKLTYDPWYSELVEETNSPDIVCTTIQPAKEFLPNGKTCCYNTKTNLWVQDIPYAGGLYHFHPDEFVREHTIHDLDAKAACCYGSNLCDKYYQLHPIGDCYRETWFGVGTLWGDPHLKTLDNKGFTFNGLGEFHLLQVEKDGKLFQLQARTERPLKDDNTPSEATVFSAFAANDGIDAKFHVELNRNKTGFDVYGNLDDLTLKARKRNFKYKAKEGNLMITKRGDTLIAFFPSFGISLNVTTNVRMFSTVVLINNTFQGKTRGLLGNFNGDPSDDFILPNGIKQNANMTEREIFHYGMNWSIDANSSVFNYTKGKGHDDFHNASYVPKFLEDAPPQKRADAVDVCGGEDNVQCIYDFVFTDSAEIANQTLITNEISVEDKQEIDLKIPSIGGCILDVINLGEEVVCQLNVFNYEDKIVVKGLNKDNYELNNVTNTLKFKIENAEPVKVSVSAESSNGKQSPETSIKVLLCKGCSGRGSCKLGEITSDQYKVAECICDTGYDGPNCENDFDGCYSKPCSQYRTCTDLSPEEHMQQNRSHTCGPCPEGFRITDQEKCVDIDECEENMSGCAQDCINTDGGYYCGCGTGYRLDTTDTHLCNDINECEEGVHGCEHVCINTPGSFQCMCYPGYVLDDNTRTCSQNDTEVCGSSINCSESDGCIRNDNGVGTCFCNNGYQLTDDNKCKDIDECQANVCPQDCINTVGSFQCTCYIGYNRSDETTCQACKFPSWGVDCSETCDCPDATGCDHVRGCYCEPGWTGVKCDEDIDECVEGIDVCTDVRTRCINTDGDFYCGCIDGYQLSDTSPHECTDIDECSSPLLHECEQTCTNAIGGYTCGCTDGYSKQNNTHCQDVDECALQTAGCQHICENFDGSFNCYCEFGYILKDDRRSCIVDENPCETNGINCTHVCITDVISRTISCGCEPGYKLGADELSCLDVQECGDPDLNQCGGDSTCVNERGSYRCECPTGFKLQNDARTCTECDDFHYGVDCSQTCSCIKGTCDNERGCICEEGWTGVNCDQDKDECQSIDAPCDGQNVNCLNTLGGYRCTCSKGFENNTGTCQDIDECDTTETHDCDQTCENTIGGYLCQCNSGFIRVNGACKDIDECLLQHECDQNCENTVGSYRCSCRTGYHLDLSNRKSCQPEVACNKTMVALCNESNADCFVIDDVQNCSCRNGYDIHNQTSDICHDIDECEGDHPCAHTCDNLVGGYMCVCNEGFQLDVDQVSCKECDDGTYGSNCSDKCVCVTDNTRRCNPVNGSCICQEGWMGDTCDLDINECKDTSICPTNSQCTNTNGTFTCDCIVGYQKTGSGTCEGCQPFYFGEACAERCECNTTTTLMCDTNNGTCRCKEGWESSDCSLDVDECTANTSICSDVSNSNCMNNPGGYECECQAGFYKEGELCIDIDECQETKDRCNQDCEDTEGSFTCKCFDGYHGDGVNCAECDTNTYGFNCSLECPCNITNSQTGSQSCTPSTGECVCKAEWTGANCTVDVNECQNTSLCGGDDQFSGCHNLEGGYSCECYIGYRKNPVGKCIPDTSSSRTTKSALSMKEVKLALTLEVSLPAGTNLNIAATYAYYETTAIETLTAYYESVGITSVVVVINSLSEGSLKVDFTLLYEDVDDVAQRLGRATVQLTRGVDLVFQNQNVSSTLDLSENLTDICDIYESLFGQCRIGYKCQVEDNEPICKEDIVADSFGLIIGLSTGGFVALLALVLIALCMRVMREKRELKKQAVKNGECRNFENKVDCPIADTCSDRSVISGFGFNRDPSSKWFSQPRESLTASNGSNRQGFEQVTSDNRFILYRPQMSTFTPKLLLGHSNRKGYSEEVPNVPTPDYF